MNIEEMKSAISAGSGLAQANHFRVILNGPDGLGDDRLRVLAKSVTMPGRTITTIDVMSMGQSRKVAHGFSESDIKISFILTNDFIARKYLMGWLEKVVNFKTGRVGYKNDYVGSITIEQLDRNDNTVYTINIINAFPTSIDEYTMDSSADNQILELSVTFTYENYSEG